MHLLPPLLYFFKLNQINISLQGKDSHLLQLHDKITTFKRKLQLWKTDLLINNEQCDSFSLLKSHLNSKSGNLSLQNTDECDMKTVICSHLVALVSHFEKYFSEDMEKHNCKRNSFVQRWANCGSRAACCSPTFRLWLFQLNNNNEIEQCTIVIYS